MRNCTGPRGRAKIRSRWPNTTRVQVRNNCRQGEVGREVFEGRAAIGYNQGYDAEVFYLGLALDPKNVEGFVEGCLERIGEDDPDGEMFLQAGRGDLFFDVRPQQNVVLNEG